MESTVNGRKKRATEKLDDDQAKRSKHVENENNNTVEYTAGKVKSIRVRNFMCHEALEIELNENVNFIVGRNGSGKSAILTALTVGLGARANVTSRGTSIKEFIKKGKNSATIEITLINKGDTAFKQDIYGDTITVVRTIGNSSTYRIKNWRGDIISTKRDELDSIVETMNIQVDNPISVLNQDVSRTFLVSSKADEKYNLFMKATLLDAIKNNYKEALEICEGEYNKLKLNSEALLQIKTEIERLKENIHRLEEIDELRTESNYLEMELQWAKTIVEEFKLNKIQETLKMHENNLKELENVELAVRKKDEEVDVKIKEVKQEIQKAEQEVMDSTEAYNSAKEKYTAAREAHTNKQREWYTITNKRKRLEEDINLLKKEVQKLENCNSEEHSKRKEMLERLSKLEEKLDELEASLRTKQTESMHLEADKMRLMQEEQSAKNEVENFNRHTNKIQKDLRAFEQQSDNALSVFGPNIPRLLRRIEEEYKKKRFKEKPRGPIGAYIKVKDASWTPAIENYLNLHMLSSFCVDNSQDAKLLNSIMKEIFHNQKIPQIICAKFFNQVHDVRTYWTKSSQHSNLFEAMIIEDPIVTNCLIDQCQIECVLLIPTSSEACEIMSDAMKVPRNCKRAFTKQGDLFYPDPNYRTYGGKCGTRAKFLQVSTMEAIQALREELQVIENKKQEAFTAHKTVNDKIKRTSFELSNVSATIRKLKSAQSECTDMINELKDKIDSSEATSADVFRNEAAELEKQLTMDSAKEKLLAENVGELKKNAESLNTEVKHFRDLRHNLHTVIDPLNDQIKELVQEKEKYRLQCLRATRKLPETRQAIQCATGEFELQERATKKAVSTATERCSRINTTKTVSQIKTELSDLRDKIHEVEHQYGSVDDLRQTLKENEEKYGVNIEFASQLEQSWENHMERLNCRQSTFMKLRDLYSTLIQRSFTAMLCLRQYKGTVVIDHESKSLDLKVNARDEKKINSDTRSLSGGERSYSTVAFILALWECIQLPFYFLDEFDVFMDKVNRRVIMDILLAHTKSHPESQFVFLTPLDTSHIVSNDYITIHQLQPPERRGLSQ